MSIEDSRFEPQPGLFCREVKICSGPLVADGSRVTLLYKVALTEQGLETSDCLESNFAPDIPIDVVASEDALLSGVYWTLLGMRGGGSVRRAEIPSALGFGQHGSGDGRIPPDASVWVELCVSQVADSMGELVSVIDSEPGTT